MLKGRAKSSDARTLANVVVLLNLAQETKGFLEARSGKAIEPGSFAALKRAISRAQTELSAEARTELEKTVKLDEWSASISAIESGLTETERRKQELEAQIRSFKQQHP